MTAERAAWVARALSGPAELEGLSRAEAAAMLVELAGLQAALAGRLSAPSPQPTTRRDAAESDRLLTVSQVAERLGVTPRWLYRHAKDLPFARRLTRKTLRFSEVGLRQWQAARGSK